MKWGIVVERDGLGRLETYPTTTRMPLVMLLNGMAWLLIAGASMKQTLIALAGAVLGGALGYFAFRWMARQGYYGLILSDNDSITLVMIAVGGVLGVWVPFRHRETTGPTVPRRE